jgi:uncharacterized protein with von Willebrand factor type A (vWA) domain
MEGFLNYLSSERRGQHALDRLDVMDLQTADRLAGLDAAQQAIDPTAEEYPPALRLFQDTQLALYKGGPRLRDDAKEMPPSHCLNHAVLDRAMGERRFRELRLRTCLDETMSLLGAMNLWEQLMDLLSEEQQTAAREAAARERHAAERRAQAETLQAMAELAAQRGDEKMSQQASQQAQDLRAQADAAYQEAQAAMDQALDNAPSDREIRQAVKEAVDRTDEQGESMNGWGLSPGALQRVPPEQRLALAERVMASEKLRRLAKMVGRFRNLAIAAQAEKAERAPGQIAGIELGADLQRMLASEVALLHHPALKLELYRRLVEHQVMQYQMTGRRRLALGPLVVCYDESGSMTTEKELWAKAVVLAMLFIARRQQRPFSGIAFGGPGQIRAKTLRRRSRATMEDILEVAEPFFNGGTDFCTPLTKAQEIIEQEGDFKRADIVFVTDGIARVTDSFLTDFRGFKERTKTRVFTVLIDVGSSSEVSVRKWSDQIHRVVDLACDAEAAKDAAVAAFRAV